MDPKRPKDNFGQQIEETYHKLDALLKRVSGSSEEAAVAAEALEELATTLEELHAANDELNNQNEVLAATQAILEADRQRYLDLFEFAPDSYLVTDNKGVIREANQAAALLLNVPAKRLVGKPLAVFVVEAERKEFRNGLSKLLSQAPAESQNWSLTLQPRRGKTLMASLTIAVVKDGSDRSSGVRWMIQDITVRKEDEAELDKYHFLQQELAEKRTTELTSANVQLKGEITEWERIDFILRTSEGNARKQAAELDAVISSLPGSVTIYDKNGRAVRTNKLSDDFLGYMETSGEAHVEGQTPAVQVRNASGEPLEFHNRPAQRALAGELVRGEILEIQNGMEEPVWISSSASPIYKEGALSGAVEVVTDITPIKAMEEELSRSEKKYRELIKYAPVGIYQIDFQTRRFTSVNEVICQQTGYTRDELLAMTPFDLLDKESQALFAERIHNWLEGEKPPENVEYRLITKDGREIYAVLNVTFTRDEHGAPQGATVVGYDITERKHAEAETQKLLTAVQSEKDRLSTLVELSPDAIFVNRQNKIVLVNQAALDLFGADSAAQVLGKSPFDFFHPTHHDQILQRIQILFAGGNVPIVEVKVVRLDGTLRTAEVTAALISDSEGQAAQVILHDVTERKEREVELRRLNRTLKALSDINQSMVHAIDEAGYMEEVCRIVLEDCGHAMVWIGLAQDDEAKSVKPVSSAGFEAGYLETLKVSWADTERGRGPTGTAIRTGQGRICRNMLTDPAFEPWRKEALKRGYAASVALPLISDEKPFGALTIYSREADPFSESEMELLGELASDLAYGITMLRTRLAHEQVEKALKESEARFKQLADASFEGLVIHDNGMLLDINMRITEMVGYAPEDLIGKPFWEFIDPKYHAIVSERVRAGSPELYEVELIHKDGRRVPVEVVGRPLQWKGKQVRVSALRDITERRRAETALRESEARYRSLFNGMTEGFALHEAIYDEEGKVVDYRFLDINTAFEQLTGLKRENVLGQTHNELLPDDSPFWVEVYGKVVLTGEPVQFDNYSSTLKRHYDVRAYRPAPGQFAAIFMDITDQKEMEENLRVNLAKYTTLFESFPLGITVSDEDGQILETNQEAAKLLGITGQEQMRRRLGGAEWKIVHPDGTPMAADEYASMRALKEKRRIENQEMGILRKGNQVTWLSVTAAPLFVEGYGVVVTYGDISERKRLENELKKARTQAEQRANELDAVFNSITDGIIVFDPQGRARQSNRVAVGMLGLDPSNKKLGELANAFSTSTIDGQLLKLADAPTTRALSGQTVTGERYILHKQEKADLIVTISASPLWEGERIAGAVAVMQDVTDQYRAEEIQAWLASFPELNPNPVTEMDETGKLNYMNPVSRLLFPDLESKGKDHPWLNGMDAIIEEVRRGKETTISREVQIGEAYYLQSVSIVPQNGRARIYGFEITKRKRAEKSLERSNERLALISETVSQLLASSEPQRMVEELVRKVLDHLDCQVSFNYLVDEKAGRLHLNACAGIPAKAVRRVEWLDFGQMVCGRVARDGERIVAEDIPLTKDPRTDLVRGFGVQAYACHPLMVQGKVIGTLSFGTRTRTHFSEDDLSLMKTITDHVAIAMGRYKAELAVIQARDELEQRVLERTRELRAANKQLRVERQRFNNVLDDLPAYLVLLTPDYHVSFANRYFEERFGKSEGRRCYEYLFNRTEPCEICDTYRTLKNNEPQRWEWTGPDQRNYDIHDFPFTDVDGSNLILEMGIDITERKQAEAELEKYRQHLEELVRERTTELANERANLQKIFDVVNVGMLLVDEGGNVKRINDVIRRWTGREDADLSRLQPGDALGCIRALSEPLGCGHTPYCSTCQIRRAFESVLRTGEPEHGLEVNSSLRLKDGETSRWFNVSADPLDVDGRRNVILALNDITDRKLVEQALQQAHDELEERVAQRTQELRITNAQLVNEVADRKRAEVQLRLQTSAMEAAANGIIITDCDGTIQWANPAFEQVSGYSPEEVIGQNPRLWKSGKHNRTFYKKMWQTLLSGQVWHGEIINKRKTGELYTEEEIITPVRDEKNEISHFIAIKQDISSRKEAEEALRLANAYNRSLIEASIDPLATVTPTGKIGDVNSATEKMTGRSRQELIGTDFHGYFSDPAKARQAYQKVFEAGSVHDYELEVRHKDGHVTPVLYNASVYRDERDKVQGAFAVARDITDRKQFEAQLMQAEKHAVIGRMVGSVTHEINNPLQTIKNCLYLIQQDTPTDSSILEPLDMATSETTRLTDLVGQLRELYRPSTDVRDHPHEVQDILEEVHALLTPHLNNSNVKWIPLTGMQRCYINCVRDQILEVFLNISMNAIEAMKSTGGRLSVDMAFKEEKVGVAFRDTGPGISEEILPHIFEPFMTTKSSGLGLGLSISYGIIQRHGGQIVVENSPEGGAVFTIWLPVGRKNKKENKRHATKR